MNGSELRQDGQDSIGVLGVFEDPGTPGVNVVRLHVPHGPHAPLGACRNHLKALRGRPARMKVTIALPENVPTVADCKNRK